MEDFIDNLPKPERATERRILNTQYSVNIDIVDSRKLRELFPELGALIITETGTLCVGNGDRWILLTQGSDGEINPRQ